MIKTDDYPYFKCKFEEFNPVQEACYNYFTEDCNLVVASSMASGKTTIAECVLSYELLRDKSTKVCYTSPLKALSKEKLDDWSNVEPFNGVGLALISGDSYVKNKDLVDKRMMLSTIEALDVRVRKRAEWTKQLSCLVFDEAHLLGHSKRGSDSEAMIMNLTKINPDCRIIFLSGTLENAIEIAKWLKKLNGKTTKFVKSEWRPVEVDKEIVLYSSHNDQLLKTKEIIEDSFYEKVLVFVHSKKIGKDLVEYLISQGINCAFYHSGLDKKRKDNIAKRFSNEQSGLDVLVSTSALGMGINL